MVYYITVYYIQLRVDNLFVLLIICNSLDQPTENTLLNSYVHCNDENLVGRISKGTNLARKFAGEFHNW